MTTSRSIPACSLALASLLLLARCGVASPSGADAGAASTPADAAAADAAAAPDAGLQPDAAVAPDASSPAPCSPACVQHQVCCAAPLPCAGRCVLDCREPGNTCPAQLPECSQQTGVCEAGGTSADVESELLTVRNPTSGVDWWAKALYPKDASATRRYPAVVSVPGGSGAGSASENEPDPNRNPARLAAQGYVVVIFDADGRGNTGGQEDYCGSVHQDGLKALVEKVAALPYVDPAKLGVSTASFGITMGSGLLARYPALPVKFLVDFEGPADRDDTGHCDASDTGHITHACDDDAWWSQREAASFIEQVQVPYLRIQNQQDHAQPDNLHCILMINHATAAAHGGQGVAPWTRVNLASMNAADRTYTAASPPAYNAAKATPATVDLWAELFAMQ